MRVETARVTAVIQNSKLKIANPSWAAVMGVSVMVVYLLLLPFVERTWRATGDEPHYLLAAHSLVMDRDFDLSNNYDQLDYLAFYFSQDIDRQVRVDRAGRQILNHQLGLPVLIAPAYALGGRFGVLIFQAVLGGVLAALTFKLAASVSRDEKAAFVVTLLVMLTPPLLMYHYLIYPELIGAVLTTLVLYLALTRSQATPAGAAWVILSLIALPWLNRRFIPLALLLALFIAWAWDSPISNLIKNFTAWFVPVDKQTPNEHATRNFILSEAEGTRHVSSFQSLIGGVGFLTLVATVLSITLLLWFNSQLSQPVRVDIAAPGDASLVWTRLGRGIGWLVDQQRGLFIFAPVYMLVWWGLPPLFLHSHRHRFVVVPLVVSLGVTTLAGGYWVPWELGPRFLVIALPGLAPVLALAWRHYGHHKTWRGLAMLLFAVSLINSLVIIRNPELAYKSSLPVVYGQKLGLPLTELLPDLAGYARVSPAEADPAKNQIVVQAGASVWFAEAGRVVSIARPGALDELPFGHYRLIWPVRVDPGLAPDTEVMRISAKFLGGGPLFNKIITAADLPGDGSYGLIEHAFINTNPDRWRTPMTFHAVSTGRSNVWGQDILFIPNPFYAWVLPYFYLALLTAGAFLSWRRCRASDRSPIKANRISLFTLPKSAAWGLLLILPIVAVGYVTFQKNLNSRTYEAEHLQHLVGQPQADPDASDGQAWSVDPLTDPPQKAIFGPFDIYDPGQYHVAFRIKIPQGVTTGQPLARLRVAAAAGPEGLMAQSIRADHFSRPAHYHDFVLIVDNPRRQALSFEVDYLGVAALMIDEVTITTSKGL